MSKETVYFAVGEEGSSVSRNQQYPVKRGMIAVTDADDVEAFRSQGYRETAPPAAGRQAKPPEKQSGEGAGGDDAKGQKAD